MHKNLIGILLLFLLQTGCAQESPRIAQAGPNVSPMETGSEQTTTPASWTVDELTGKFDPAKHPDFVQIQSVYTTKTGIYLRKETMSAFIRMYEAAAKEQVKLSILSATRNFEYQKGIWEKKWKREKYNGWRDLDKVKDIMKLSSMPGTSRHHWGTDIDLNSVDPAFFKSGEGLKIYNWLKANAATYGFFQTYTDKSGGRTGYEEEKWHWSYIPLAGEMLKSYNLQVKYSDINGFSGSAEAKGANIFELYVNGIDAALKK